MEGKAYPKGWYHFPEYSQEYFKQLTAEQLVKRSDKKGFAKYEWEKVRDRNEALDLKVYNRAASIILGIDKLPISALQTQVESPDIKSNQDPMLLPEVSKNKKRKKRQDSFWD